MSVLSLARDPSGALAISSADGIHLYRDGKMAPALPQLPYILARNTLLEAAAKGGMWIATGRELYYLKGGFLSGNAPELAATMNRPIWRIQEDRAGRLWVFELNGRIGILENGHIHFVGLNPAGSQGLVSGFVQYEDVNGIHWLGTGSGIYLWRPGEDSPRLSRRIV